MARLAIAAVGNERRPLAIGHGTVRDGVRVKQGAVPGTYAIEREMRAVMADLDHAAGMLDPARRTGHANWYLARAGPDRGLDRIFRKQMKNVGQQQFLVLLLVMTAEPDQFAR